MASLEQRSGSWRVVFRFKGQKRSFTVGEVSAADAEAHKTDAEELLRLLDRGRIVIPAGCTVEDYLFHKGNPPKPEADAPAEDLTLGRLREAYFKAQGARLEQTTLDGISLHFCHLERLLGKGRALAPLTTADLQGYVDARSREWIDPDVYRRRREQKAAARKKEALAAGRTPRQPRAASPEQPARAKRNPSPATIKKEVISLRTAWNWARRHLRLAVEFPGSRLEYAKTEEALPFMDWEEAERRVAAGDDPAKVWDCVYLKPEQVSELLAWVKSRPISPWTYPMFCLAAYTGARRSEIVRALPSDVDLVAGTFTVREKKKDKRKLTTRRVDLTPFLKETLAEWMTQRAGGKTLFCKESGAAITPREALNYFQRALRVSKWSVLKGWHVLRHSFCSALASKGIDQRVIDLMMGHSTEEQRRRYRHLFPDVTKNAMQAVFG